MEDYNDYTKWREDTTDIIFLDCNGSYRKEDMVGIFDDLYEKAKAKGLVNVKLQFASHQEPWEDWLGNPSVCAIGHRPLTEHEKEELEDYNKIAKLSEDKGIPHYQAKKLYELIKLGVVEAK